MRKPDLGGCEKCVEAMNNVIKVVKQEIETELERKAEQRARPETIKELDDGVKFLNEMESFIFVTKDRIKRECDILRLKEAGM